MPTEYSSLSLWLSEFPGDLSPRAALDGDCQTDLAIVGGGFTGLWTAYYLAERDPSLSITVIERDICGFGASARNGGWCVGELASGVEAYARRRSLDSAVRLMRYVHAAVDEVARVVSAEGIDCGFAKGGWVRFARNRPQADRQRAELAEYRSLGFGEEVIRALDADEVREHARPTGLHSGLFYAPCAALDPARLVRGLAEAVERRGVRIVEQTAVTGIDPSTGVRTDRGVIAAEAVIVATEAYTRDLPGRRRSLVPLYSLMVATAPLEDAVLAEIGLDARPTFSDDRYVVIYGQRTADDRIAFGGRGVPYLFGSRIAPAVERHAPTHERIAGTLVNLFPALAGTNITHRWGGVLAAPRNWLPSVRFDRRSGVGTAGGYVGEGVAPSNLAGRTLADLVTGTDSELVDLAWVGIESRRWEFEPLRWLGIRGTRAVMSRADRVESASGRESRLGRAAYELLR